MKKCVLKLQARRLTVRIVFCSISSLHLSAVNLAVNSRNKYDSCSKTSGRVATHTCIGRQDDFILIQNHTHERTWKHTHELKANNAAGELLYSILYCSILVYSKEECLKLWPSGG